MLRPGLGLRSRCLGGLRSLRGLGRWRRELGRGKALRLSMRLRLRLSMRGARRPGLWLCLGRGLRRRRKGRCSGGRLGLHAGLGLLRRQARGHLPTGRLSLPRILGLRGQSMGDGGGLGGKLRLRRGPRLGRSLGQRGDLAR